MIKAVLDRQLMISVNNDVGMLAAVTSVITSTGINLLANCAYAIEDKAAFMFVTDDNNAAKKLLESHNVNVHEEEVILLFSPSMSIEIAPIEELILPLFPLKVID